MRLWVFWAKHAANKYLVKSNHSDPRGGSIIIDGMILECDR